VAVQGANASHTLFESFAPILKPNHTRGSDAAKFYSTSLNLGTHLPGEPLSGAKENAYFATPSLFGTEVGTQ
jgi:hypothetical protein